MANKIKQFAETIYVFYCPGCEYGHPFDITRWEWNGSLYKPSFTPSLLVNGFDDKYRCHSYITDGNIRFLDDCFHKLAGKTVELPDYE